MQQFKALGNKVTEGDLEAIDLGEDNHISEVFFRSDEVAAICPVTGQPDWYTVKIVLMVDKHSIESKSLKLYFQKFRNEGIFCEKLADQICKDISDAAQPHSCDVSVKQKSRGGITLDATAIYSRRSLGT